MTNIIELHRTEGWIGALTWTGKPEQTLARFEGSSPVTLEDALGFVRGALRGLDSIGVVEHVDFERDVHAEQLPDGSIRATARFLWKRSIPEEKIALIDQFSADRGWLPPQCTLSSARGIWDTTESLEDRCNNLVAEALEELDREQIPDWPNLEAAIALAEYIRAFKRPT